MSLGPKRIDFIEYDPAYPRVFAQVTETISSVLPNARIEHVGSTSVPRPGGRGTLDAVLLSEPAEDPTVVSALLSAGFTNFLYGPAQPAFTTTIHLGGRDYGVLLYVLPPGHELVRGWLAFREFMKRHPEEIERYAAIKRKAVAEGQTEPRTYQQAKTPYLVELAQRIDRDPAGR